MRLQEHEEENEEEEEELIFHDIFHRLTFVIVFYGEMIFLISSLQIPCEMYTKRTPRILMDGGMDMDGCKDMSRNTTSPLLLLHFSYTNMPVPSLITSFNPDN